MKPAKLRRGIYNRDHRTQTISISSVRRLLSPTLIPPKKPSCEHWHDGVGSFTSFSRCLRYVRFAPIATGILDQQLRLVRSYRKRAEARASIRLLFGGT